MLVPIVKWAGGKRQIINEILKYFPAKEDFNNYHEPFIGGGSIFMELYNRNLLDNKEVYLSDRMDTLIKMYQIIKNKHAELIGELSKEDYKNERVTFDEIKKTFNRLKISDNGGDNGGDNGISNEIKMSAQFIYLNKVCFNGLYRENKLGEFNIPFGKQKNPIICNTDAINKLHNFLSKAHVKLECADFESGFNNINSGDFIYMDPPYYGTFSDYTKYKFLDSEHVRLRDYISKLTSKGCKVAISNSDTEYIRNLYKDIPNIKFNEIQVKRMINSNGQKRKNTITELLITNY